MDIFVSNIPLGYNDAKLKRQLKSHLTALGCFAYDVRILNARSTRGKSSYIANLLLPTMKLGEKFLSLFGGQRPISKIVIDRRPIWFKLNDRQTCETERYTLKSIVHLQDKAVKEREAAKNVQISQHRHHGSDGLTKTFDITQLECGVWDPETNGLAFTSRYSVNLSLGDGCIRFLHQKIVIEVRLPSVRHPSQKDRCTAVFHHFDYPRLITDGREWIYLTIWKCAPRFYRHAWQSELEFVEGRQQNMRTRVSALDRGHAEAAPTLSYVYRVKLSTTFDHGKVLALSKRAGNPPITSRTITTKSPAMKFEEAIRKLLKDIFEFDYRVAFQLNAIFTNGMLIPESIIVILPRVRELVRDVGSMEAADVLRHFAQSELGNINPLEEPGSVNKEHILELFEYCIQFNADKRRADGYQTMTRKQQSMARIHRAYITPAGIFFNGPRLEVSNRVLRKFPDHHHHFLRVTFAEEDGDAFQTEANVIPDEIYDQQFLPRLLVASGQPIVIGSRRFSFLGFSSSSLQSGTCWYMASFNFNGVEMTPANLVKSLGDFTGIRTPGRVAARVGQAFSDTLSSVEVPEMHDTEIPDITRPDSKGQDRCFSDGIGTISRSMLERIWKLTDERRLRATVLQIRFAGAKGVVSLDDTLDGDKLCLRKSMVKFRGSKDRNIEICQWAARLPCFLNRPLIQVLEGLKVIPKTFLDMQAAEVLRLRDSATSAQLAANFLKRQSGCSTSLRVPWVIEVLQNIGIDFREDEFLSRALELALLVALRSLKYKARIPVPKGVTLMGVVDETNFLGPNEVYASFDTDNGELEVVKGKVMITRSPVNHPGDVQMVRAVQNLPPGSPLRLLKNCVVFSQKGDRDVPSMLSGGDLDGDLYNVIYDPRFFLPELFDPADYPRQSPKDLGRQVELDDIAQFFIDYMKNSLLGLISTRRLILADQIGPKGIFDPACIKLAMMASTAVDFPKTGIMVERKEIPRCSKARPDFLAPGPRVFVKKEMALQEEDDEEDREEEDGGILWYPSDGVLGKLYRAIDEQGFLAQLKADLTALREEKDHNRTVLVRVRDYMESEIKRLAIAVSWQSYVDHAKIVRDEYEYELYSLRYEYSETPWKSPLEEVEVWIGTVMGGGRQSRRERQWSTELRTAFDDLAQKTIYSMRERTVDETVANAMACLVVATTETGKRGRRERESKSFGWVAASVLLVEVDKVQVEVKKQRRNVLRVG